jgi:hypothetical protein
LVVEASKWPFIWDLATELRVKDNAPYLQ